MKTAFLRKILTVIPMLAISGLNASVSALTDNSAIYYLADNSITLEQAKSNTLIFIAVVIIFLLLLVSLGYWLEGRKVKIDSLKVLLVSFSILGASFFMKQEAHAFCPVCTIAVGAGLGVSKSLGIDDLITSIWIGGLLLSMSLWTIEWLNKRRIRFLFRKPLIFLLYYGLVVIPFQSGGIIGNMYNELWGVDKVVLGIMLGTLGFSFGMAINAFLIRGNKGRVYFPFQKVVVPIIILNLLSLIFYFIVY